MKKGVVTLGDVKLPDWLVNDLTARGVKKIKKRAFLQNHERGSELVVEMPDPDDGESTIWAHLLRLDISKPSNGAEGLPFYANISPERLSGDPSQVLHFAK